MSGAGRKDEGGDAAGEQSSTAADAVRLDPEMALALVRAERDQHVAKYRAQLDGVAHRADALETEGRIAADNIRALAAESRISADNIRRLQHDRDSLLRGQKKLWQDLDALQERQIRIMAGLSRTGSKAVLPKALRSLKRLLPGRGRALRKLAKDYRAVASSALFDARWYLDAYPDVAASGVDPAYHFLLFGASEGRFPGPDFNPSRYLAANPDVQEAGVNPLLHFLHHGVFERRPLGVVERPDEPAKPEYVEGSAEPATSDRVERPKRLNDFVYETCRALDIPYPDIPVYLTEQYGQCAEDLIVSALLQAWSRKQDFNLANATYLEIGGNHPVATSASFLLHRIYGMRGVVIEANPDLLPALKQVRDFDQIVFGAMQAEDVQTVMLSVSNLSELSSLDPSFVLNWAGGGVGERRQIEVPALRINAIIENYFGGVAPNFLSIDIESLDLPVLKDLDLHRFRPVVIQAEPSDHHCPGNTGHMIDFMRDKNYALIAQTPVNLIFMSVEALMQSAAPPPSRARSVDFMRRYLAPDYLREEPWSYEGLDAYLVEAVQNRIGQLWQGIKDGHKWLNYFEAYEKCFGEYVGKACRVLEIGVNKGASLELWKRYFGDAACLVGVDIVPECAEYEDASRNIHVRIGSQADPEFLQKVAAEFGPFDIIIDDGSHMASHQIASFNALFMSALKNGGVYLIEDIETAYWGNRTGQLDTDFSIVDYAHAVVDLMHRPYCDQDYPFFMVENVRGQTLSVPQLTKYVEEVRFFDSIIAFYKNARFPPVVKYIHDAPASDVDG